MKMRNFKLIVLLLSFFLMVTACQTVQEKTDKIVEQENKRLGKYIGQLSSELKIDLGNPDEDFKNEKGNQVLVYKTKKYGISCERKFEVDTNSVVIGFSSKGCF
jgi:CRISPR/Cas system-associated protein Cas7 (RAMP superfamily)